MKTVTVEQMMKDQQACRLSVMETSDRGKSAYALAQMALKHGTSSAEAAAALLLSMEYDLSFDFKKLLTFDSENRAHADLVMLGYKPHEIWPSKWMDDAGFHGIDVIHTLRDKWTNTGQFK